MRAGLDQHLVGNTIERTEAHGAFVETELGTLAIGAQDAVDAPSVASTHFETKLPGVRRRDGVRALLSGVPAGWPAIDIHLSGHGHLHVRLQGENGDKQGDAAPDWPMLRVPRRGSRLPTRFVNEFHVCVSLMTVLVTGGAGYIGSHMVLALLDAGEKVVVVDNLSTGFRHAVRPPAVLVEGNVGDQELVSRVVREHGVRIIIHFAGSIVVPDSVADPLGYYLNNTSNSRSLIEVAVNTGVKSFIFSSTAAVYGNPKEIPVKEEAELRPVSPYGTSKLMTELMLADTAFAHDFRYVALRYFNVAGADPEGRAGQSTPRATHLIKVACETALGKRASMDVFGTDYPTADGTCIRDYIHVTDLAAAHMAALRYLDAGGKSDVFNCGYSSGYSVLEVIEAVKRASGGPFPVKLAPRRPGDAEAIVADSSKIRSKLGWQPKLANLDQIVAHAFVWERSLKA